MLLLDGIILDTFTTASLSRLFSQVNFIIITILSRKAGMFWAVWPFQIRAVLYGAKAQDSQIEKFFIFQSYYSLYAACTRLLVWKKEIP
jgi:hypothetical protein